MPVLRQETSGPRLLPSPRIGTLPSETSYCGRFMKWSRVVKRRFVKSQAQRSLTVFGQMLSCVADAQCAHQFPKVMIQADFMAVSKAS